jgi:hypothetical protein
MKEITTNLKTTFLLIILIAVFTSCAHYKEPQLPESQTSVLTFGGHIDITKIDGKDTPWNSLLTAFNPKWIFMPSDIHVAPGKHTVQIKYSSDDHHGFMEYWFIAEAGTMYAAHAETIGEDKFIAWIENTKTGKKCGEKILKNDN